MGPEAVVLVAVVALAALLLLRVPVGFALAGAGFVGIYLLSSFGTGRATLANVPYASTARYALIIIPLFILMGMVATHGGMADEALGFAGRMLHRFPGGLPLASIAACAMFAAVTGSSVATVATIGPPAIKEMRAQGYSAAFASGVIGAAGTLGVLIPPSIVLVILGVITGMSIGALLIAGIVPGILSALVYGVWVVLRADRARTTAEPEAETPVSLGPALTPQELTTHPVVPAATIKRDATATALVRPAILFVVVIGGIYAGVFSATESAAVGALVAVMMLVLQHWRAPRLAWKKLTQSLTETASLSSAIFVLLIGGGIFTYFLVSARIPGRVTEWLVSAPIPPRLLVALLLLLMIPLGMFLDGISIMLITMPLAFPVIQELGFDGLWFGILVVKMIEIGLITPPIGINAYVVAGVVRDVKAEQVFRGLAPFMMLDLVVVAILFLIPDLVTFLPGLMRS